MTAILGPTNTGKTHLAVERMCQHSGGAIGFPLRLLAREVYERVVKLKGAAQVALVTGEERIVPPQARYFLCTAESLPTDRALPFLAIDEGQMGADPERGHVFTQAMLHLRGTLETVILGSDTLAPLLRRLLPDADIQSRPRFSRLSWIEPAKLSRLPPRSAIVAFSAAEVYAVAEMLRRHRGGAAVVMGGLSPRTRNAQVDLYQAREVDYLVATDAIGMGLNMDIAHVAFAGLSKWDGRRHRRLRVGEMAQIAGRAGRHQRDGTFSTVALGHDGRQPGFEADEIEAIEQHRFPPLSSLVWRNARLDWRSVHRLIASLDAMPTAPGLIRADDAIDLDVLKRLAGEPWVLERTRSPALVQLLWRTCGLPDYRRTGPEAHARLVGRIFRHLSEPPHRLPPEWVRVELDSLDNVAGDIDALSDRIAAARTWTYIAHREDWLADAASWASRARAVEDRLSDALHDRLTQRFVDRRTSVLLRDLGARGLDAPVEVDPDGMVLVGGEGIGRLDGFRFSPDPAARAGMKRRMLAAAERRLAREYGDRASALIADPDEAFALLFEGDMPPLVAWRGARVAELARGRDALSPRLVLDRSLDALDRQEREAVHGRLTLWLAAERRRQLGRLDRLADLAHTLEGPMRGLVVQLIESLGVLPRASVAPMLDALPPADRRRLAAAGVRLGVVHLHVAGLLKPEPTRWRLAFWGVAAGVRAMPGPPAAGRVSLDIAEGWPPGWLAVAGFWGLGDFGVRVDMVDRLARSLHRQRSAGAGGGAIVPEPGLVQALGLHPARFARLMRALGFRRRGHDEPGWTYAHRLAASPGANPRRDHATPGHRPFAELQTLMRRRPMKSSRHG